MISITFFHPLLSPSLLFLHPTFPSPPSPPFFPPSYSFSPPSSFFYPPSPFLLPLPPLLSSTFLPSFFSLHSHFSIYPFLSLFLSSFLSQSSRIKTFLPEKKQLWAESEEPIATKNNREKLEQLEEEQKVPQVCLKNSELEWSNLIQRFFTISRHHTYVCI